MHHVILGAGPAGVIAAETLRKRAPYDTITLIGDEPEAPYSRMALPYWLVGHIEEGGTHLRHDPNHYAALRIALRQARAESVDTARRSVALSDGSSLVYDRLLIATGSRALRPPIPGLDSPGVHTCWTLADARAIAQRAKPGARVVQMGAGFIGCIIMEALATRGVQLTVVEMGDRMVPRMMGPTAGTMIREWVQAKGVAVHTGAKVEAIEAGTPMRVKLSTGQVLEADLVINSTGVQPQVGFLKDTGVRIDRGVVTDQFLQSSVPGVYAAGDCAEALDLLTGQYVVSAIQPNAAEQARVAAYNMTAPLGQPDAFMRMVTQINVLDTLGLISTSFGAWQGVDGGEQVELTDRARNRHVSLQFKDDVLVGCNSVGWTQHVGAMRGLVEGKVRLGRYKDELKADPTQLMKVYLGATQGQAQWLAPGRQH